MQEDNTFILSNGVRMPAIGYGELSFIILSIMMLTTIIINWEYCILSCHYRYHMCRNLEIQDRR